MANQIIEIDGSFGEGGGQILRTACALSAVTKKACHIFNIRKNRPKPGLASQHLLGIQALSQLCQGRLEGDNLGSQEIKFYPGEIKKDHIFVNIPTAGSITLVLQTLILPAFFSPKPVIISFNGGATDTFFAPTIDYFQYVFLKILEKMNAKVEMKILKRGYYPEGGAKVEVKVFPAKLKPLNLMERGELKKVFIVSGASQSLKRKKVAERQISGVREILGKLKLPFEEKIEYYDTLSPGSQICLLVEFEKTILGVDNLGKINKRAEDIGKEATLELLKEQRSDACLDRHLADQILPYLALVKGKSQVSVSQITEHVKTNIWAIERFIEGKFVVKVNSITWQPFFL
jgi:RNA 3'-phosphate cyclase